MNKPVPVAIGVVLIAVLGGACQPSAEASLTPLATASPASATAGPATAPPASPALRTTGLLAVTDLLTGGRYLFWPQEVPSLTFAATGPNGWRGFPSWALDGPDKPWGARAPSGIGIAFLTADGLYSDPCHWDVLGNGNEGQPGDVAVGPAVDDLVAAIRANTSYRSSAATPVTIDGYVGQELESQLPDDPIATCDKAPGDADGHAFVFSGEAGLYAQGPANRWHLFIVDVAGTRLIAVGLSYAGTPQTDLDIARNVIETIDFNP
jgi:hypothetical protein